MSAKTLSCVLLGLVLLSGLTEARPLGRHASRRRQLLNDVHRDWLDRFPSDADIAGDAPFEFFGDQYLDANRLPPKLEGDSIFGAPVWALLKQLNDAARDTNRVRADAGVQTSAVGDQTAQRRNATVGTVQDPLKALSLALSGAASTSGTTASSTARSNGTAVALDILGDEPGLGNFGGAGRADGFTRAVSNEGVDGEGGTQAGTRTVTAGLTSAGDQAINPIATITAVIPALDILRVGQRTGGQSQFGAASQAIGQKVSSILKTATLGLNSKAEPGGLPGAPQMRQPGLPDGPPDGKPFNAGGGVGIVYGETVDEVGRPFTDDANLNQNVRAVGTANEFGYTRGSTAGVSSGGSTYAARNRVALGAFGTGFSIVKGGAASSTILPTNEDVKVPPAGIVGGNDKLVGTEVGPASG